MTRRKPFLTYFILCAIPLLLLAGLNYWNGLRSVNSSVGAVVQNDLNAFNVAIDEELRERKSDFLKLGMMEELQYLADKELAASAVMPQGVYLKLRPLPDLSRQFRTLTVFDGNRHPMWMRKGDAEWKGIESSQAANIAQPDPHVWELQGNVSVENTGSEASTREYSAPIHDAKGTNNIGALVGVLDLDNVFTKAARGLEMKSGQLMVLALDRSGKIVYHSNRSLKDLAANQALPGFNSIANAMTNPSVKYKNRFQNVTL